MAGAACPRETVQSTVPTLFGSGVQAIEALLCKFEGCKPMEAVCDAPFKEAVTMAVWTLVTTPALAVKVATREPAATVTDPGTVSAVVLLDSVTVTPPDPAALASVTVHVDVPPGLRFPGVQASELKVPGADPLGDTVTVAVCMLPL